MRFSLLSFALVPVLLLGACTTGTDTTVDTPTPPAMPGDNAAGGSTRPAAGEPARNDLANRLNVDPADITLVEAIETEWPDACLGLAEEDEFCAQVITPGYDVLLTYEGTEYHYRTDIEGDIVRAE